MALLFLLIILDRSMNLLMLKQLAYSGKMINWERATRFNVALSSTIPSLPPTAFARC